MFVTYALDQESMKTGEGSAYATTDKATLTCSGRQHRLHTIDGCQRYDLWSETEMIVTCRHMNYLNCYK